MPLARRPRPRGPPRRPRSFAMSSATASSSTWYGPREGWLSVFLLAAVLWCVVHSVEAAEWSDNLDLLVPLAWFGMAVGIVGAKSGLRRRSLHILAGVIGVETIVLTFGNRMTAT